MIRKPGEMKKMLRIPFTMEEYGILNIEVERLKEAGKFANRNSVAGLVADYLIARINELQKEMDENNCIILNIDYPVSCDATCAAFTYLPQDIFDKSLKLAKFCGFSQIRLARYLVLKDINKLRYSQ